MSTAIHCVETQYFSITTCKRNGFNEAGDLVVMPFDSDEKDFEDNHLRHAIVYAVMHPAFKLYWFAVVDPMWPMPITEFLSKVWSETRADSAGKPMFLEVKQSIIELDAGFIQWLNDENIEVKTPRSPKSFVKMEQTVGKETDCLDTLCKLWRVELTLDNANYALDEFFAFNNKLNSESSVIRATFKAFCERDKKFASHPIINRDWAIQKFEIAPNPPRIYSSIPNVDMTKPYMYRPEGLKELLDQWPGGRNRLFDVLDVDAKSIDSWLACRSTISQRVKTVLYKMFDVDSEVNMDGDLYVIINGGGIVSVAGNTNKVKTLYDEMSHGGDLRISNELVSPKGERASMRVLCYARHSRSINLMLFPEGCKQAKLLDSKNALINLNEPVRTSIAVWNDIVRLIDGHLDIEAPHLEAWRIEMLHQQWFENLEKEQARW